MIHQFAAFELDTDRFELRADGEVQPIEPQVFALLALLIENRDRMVSKDEILEKVWDGRIVSESAVASRIKSARRAIGDDGKAQRLIKTLHGRGFRFVAEARTRRSDERVAVLERGGPTSEHETRTADEAAAAIGSASRPDAQSTALPPAPSDAAPSRPSLAVLPFRLIGDAGPYAAIADALPDELIAELSRLRWLFVTARTSSFRLRAADPDMREVGRLLGVRYALSGSVEITGSRLDATVELVDTSDAGVVWADRFATTIEDVHGVREEIRGRILSALEIRIPLHEASRARQAVPEALDAWSAFHLGLQHLYRFNRSDSLAAAGLFERSIAIAPDFARAHAGLSFVHFQAAFLRHTDDVPGETALARRFAERGVDLDPLDPFVHFTMGRSYWLEGDLDRSLVWLERATTISPHYAQGIYARGWTESLSGLAVPARAHVDLAMRLSPLDPLHYAMLGARAFTHMDTGEDAEAAIWAERAARSPGAHVMIAMIAVAANALAGDDERARAWAADVRARNAALTQADFFRSFPMQVESLRRRVGDALGRIGF